MNEKKNTIESLSAEREQLTLKCIEVVPVLRLAMQLIFTQDFFKM